MSEKNVLQEARSKFFDKLMKILDGAERERNPDQGPFSFLWDNSYVRKAVVSSITSTKMSGLKMFLAINVLEMHAKDNADNISYKQLKAIVDGDATTHKYGLNYTVLDECMDIEKNKQAMLERIFAPIEDEETIKHIQETDTWIPYIFMDRLRKEVWMRLREFFKLCDQKTCSECDKKSMVYFKFLQAVALYEIFYIEFVQDSAAEYLLQVATMINTMKENVNKLDLLGTSLMDCEHPQVLEHVPAVQSIAETLWGTIEKEPIKRIHNVGIFQLLVIEFGISLNAMCYMLMVLEAMNVCNNKMKDMEHLSIKIRERLSEIYEKELLTLTKYNHKRYKRYREVNINLEELLKNQYPSCQDYDASDIIYTFMVELCKPVNAQNKNILRGFEVLLGYPIYMSNKNSSGVNWIQ